MSVMYFNIYLFDFSQSSMYNTPMNVSADNERSHLMTSFQSTNYALTRSSDSTVEIWIQNKAISTGKISGKISGVW